MAGSSEQELAIRIAGKVENSLKQSLGMTEDGLNRLAGTAKKATAIAATAFATVKVGEFIKDSVSAAMDFESAMADVAKVVDGLKDDNGELTQSYHDISDSIIEMSKNIPMTAEELATIMASAGQAGIATEDLTRFTETAAKMGIAFGSTAEEAGNWMAIWRTALQMTQDDVEILGDQINYLGNTSSENALKLSQIVTDIGSLAKISGVSAADLAALGAATTGINADVASTGLKNMFVAMGQGASATKKQQDVLEKLGFTATDVAQRMQTDSKAMILDLLSAINMLPKAEQEAAISTYFGKESLSTVAVLANNVSNLKEQFNKVADSTKYAGSMEKEYEARAATSANNVQLLQNKFKALQIQIGTYLLPIMNVGMDILSGAIDIFAEMTKSGDGFLLTITAIGVAVGTVKFYQLVTGIYSAVKAMAILNIAKVKDMALTAAIHGLYIQDAILKAANTAQTYAAVAGQWVWNTAAAVGSTVTSALGTAFAFLTGPIGLAILAIAAIIAIGVLLWKNWDTVKEKAGQLGAWIGEKFGTMKEAIGNAVEGFKNKFPVVFAFIEGVFNGFKATVDGAIGGVKQIFQGVIDFVKGVFTGNWRMALDGLKNIFSGVFNSLGAIAMAPLNTLGGIVTGAFNAIDTATGGKLSEIKAKATEAWNNVKDTAGNALQAAKDTISEKLNNIKAAYEAHGGGIQGVAAGAMEGMKGYYSAGFTFINNLTGGKLGEIKSAISTKMSEAQAAVGTVLEGIKSKFQSIMDGAKSIVSGAIESIKGFFNFQWELPKLKMPHFSVTGEFSLGPPPKIPKFGVEWYKDGGIMTEPTLFGMNGNNAMVGGEAGAEAILPLSELWKNMGSFIDRAINNPSGTIGSVIQLLIQRVEDFAVGSQRTSIAALATTGGGGYDSNDSGGVTINYAPIYRFEGEAPSKTDLVAAEKMSQAEFDKMMRQWQKDKGRVKF